MLSPTEAESPGVQIGNEIPTGRAAVGFSVLSLDKYFGELLVRPAKKAQGLGRGRRLVYSRRIREALWCICSILSRCSTIQPASDPVNTSQIDQLGECDQCDLEMICDWG